MVWCTLTIAIVQNWRCFHGYINSKKTVNEITVFTILNDSFPCSEFEMYPMRFSGFFFSLFFSKVVLHDRAFFLLVVFLLYFIHLLVSTATVRGGKNRASVTILNSYLVFLFRTICIFNSVSWLFRAIFKLKSYNFYGFVQRKRITFATSTFADCSDWCAVCLGLETRADLKQTSFLTGELWRETNFLTRFHSTSPWEI